MEGLARRNYHQLLVQMYLYRSMEEERGKGEGVVGKKDSLKTEVLVNLR